MNKVLLSIAVISSLLVVYEVVQQLNKHDSVSLAQSAFSSWKNTHGKLYGSKSEESMRFMNFQNNLKMVEEHNKSGASWSMAMNKFADMSQVEFKQYLGFKADLKKERNDVYLDTSSVPESWDWREHGAVSNVKDQGMCGSCWAFSAVGGMEGAYFLKTGKLVSLSTQQLVSCDKGGQDQGCNGGLPDPAFDYAQKNGMETEKTYPYRGLFSFGCKYNKSQTLKDFNLVKHVDVPEKDNEQLKAAVAQQPVSIGIDAGPIQMYSSGIFDGRCGTQLDHGVVVVAYGNEGKDYWTIKNSWGASWGENGYFRVKRDSGVKTAVCGMNLMASYPVMG